MSLSEFRTTVPPTTLHVVPWEDPVIDRAGVDPRSSYVERFWLPILGPSCTLLLRRLADYLDDHPAGFDIALDETARSLGLGGAVGRHAPFLRSIDRGIHYGLMRRVGPGELAVRRRIGPLPHRLRGRLPPALQSEYGSWERPPVTLSLADARRQARRLALALRVPGRPVAETEGRLVAAGVHPALAHEAAEWARPHPTGRDHAQDVVGDHADSQPHLRP